MKWSKGEVGLLRRATPVCAAAILFAILGPALQSQTAPHAPAAAPEQRPMTQEQARELFRSVDEILAFVSQDSKLPIHHSIKRKLISRDEIGRFLRKKFDEDESAKRLERSEIVLKKFGLLDRDFELRPFLISLLTEQIAGFYDNKTKTVNLLDWIQPEEQKPVLAHELTHALQDQAVDLEHWSDSGVHGLSHSSKEDNQHLQTDELETARAAVAEGQAMAVFLDYSLRGSGKTIIDTPDIAEHLKEADAATAGSPVLARAPLLLQQSLLFPYSDGLSFEQNILKRSGRKAAFADVLANPPSSSYEIMNPEAYLAHTPVPTVALPDIHPLIDPDYLPYDVGVMGELDVRIMAELFGGREIGAALAPAWNGGLYYAAQRRSAVTPEQKRSTASLSLLYFSRWKNSDSAKSFVHLYSAQLSRKYTNVQRQQPADSGDDEVYSTSEGVALISRSGDRVFVSEGFDLPLALKLRDAISGVQGTGPTLNASQPAREPALSFARDLRAAGFYGALRALDGPASPKSTAAGNKR